MAKTYHAHTRQEELLEAFKEMTLLELSEFVKAFEDTFDVKAAAPVAMTTVQPAEDVPEVEEQTEFTVTLEGVGEKKIQVIKEVRVITKLGLSDAKALVEDLPKVVAENVDKDRAEEVKAALEKAGAIVSMR